MKLMRKDVIAFTVTCTVIGTGVWYFTVLVSDLGAHQREVWTVRNDVHQLQMDVHQLQINVRQLQTDVGMLTEGQSEMLEWIRSQQKSEDSDTEPYPDMTGDENQEISVGLTGRVRHIFVVIHGIG